MSKHRHEAGPGRASLYDEITTKIISECKRRRETTDRRLIGEAQAAAAVGFGA
jgi:hypothetical protein